MADDTSSPTPPEDAQPTPPEGQAPTPDNTPAPEGNAAQSGDNISADEIAAIVGGGASAAPEGPQVALDQSDIEALLSQVEAQKSELVFNYEGRRFASDKKLNIETYDFRNPVFLTEYDLRQVRIRQEQFVHYLAARMSMFLRMDFGLKMSKLQTIDFSKFTTSLPNPVAISLLKMDPLVGVGVLSVSPRLAMTIVDRMLGGKGHSVRQDRYLTEIEVSLLNDVVSIFAEEWCRQWADIQELTPSIAGNENNGRFLQTAASDAPMLVLCMEGDLGDCTEEIQLAIPYYMIEPLVKKIQQNSKKYVQSQANEKTFRWQDGYAGINMPLYAEWTPFEMTVRDILALREGDVLELDNKILSDTKVRLVNSTKFRGEVGLEGERVAVKITERLRKE